MDLTSKEKANIVTYLVKEIEPEFIYLFGSYARGEGRTDSDIDLAVYTHQVIDPYSLYRLAGDLGRLLNRDVQLVHLKDVNTVFAAHIIAGREELYCRNEHLMNVYNMRTFKEYALLNEERQVVLEAIAKDGSIYGKRHTAE